MSNEPSELVVTVAHPPLTWLKNYEVFVTQLLALVKARTWDLGIRLTDDEELQMLNRVFRGKDEPTDVLSFESEPHQGNPLQNLHISGDLAISLPSVRANSEYFQVSEQDELKRVTLHGILHLQGWDHATNEPSEPMLEHQERLLNQLLKEKLF